MAKNVDVIPLKTLPPLALKKDLPPPDETFDLDIEMEDETSEFGGIRCPLCQWRPKASNRWYCAPNRHPEGFSGGCGMVWNTFTTRGVCPGCGHQWRWTTCLHCHRWSRHEDWYAENEG